MAVFNPGFGGMGMVMRSRRNQYKKGTRKKTLFHTGLPPGKGPANPGAGTGTSGWKGKNINPLTVEGMRNIGKAGMYAAKPYKNLKSYKKLSKKQKASVDFGYMYAVGQIYDATIGRATDSHWGSPFGIPFGPQYPMANPHMGSYVRRKRKRYGSKRKWR